MKKADNFDAKKWLVENKVTFQSRLNENKNLGPDDFDTFKWKPQPANPKAKLEDLENEDTVSKGDFWKSDIIGNDNYSTPIYGSENNGVWTFSWDEGELSGFIEGEDFTLSNLNENSGLASKIAALPNHHTAEDTDKATLIVGKYAVVHYDESDEGGEDMYVVWDNTVDQDEIGSYDDVPEFESEDPAEVAAWLEQNA